VQLQLGMD